MTRDTRETRLPKAKHARRTMDTIGNHDAETRKSRDDQTVLIRLICRNVIDFFIIAQLVPFSRERMTEPGYQREMET